MPISGHPGTYISSQLFALTLSDNGLIPALPSLEVYDTMYPSHQAELNLEHDNDTLLLHPSTKFSQLLPAFLFEQKRD